MKILKKCVLVIVAFMTVFVVFEGLEIFENAHHDMHIGKNQTEHVTKGPGNIAKTDTIMRINSVLEDHPICETEPSLLILVASSLDNFERRQSIRDSWGNSTRNSASRTIFLVGKSKNRYLNVLLHNEVIKFKDILVGEYEDTYRNLTLKVLHGFRWVHEYCVSKFVLKTDDDCFVNVLILEHFLNKLNLTSNLYAGKVRQKAEVIRNTQSLWYVPHDVYPHAYYAPYISGSGYIISWDVLCKLVDYSSTMLLFPNEDAYVGEILYRAGIKPMHSTRFANYSSMWSLCNYLYFFVAHGVKSMMQKTLHNNAKSAVAQCSYKLYMEWC